jgi:hypothetical protein
MSLWEARAAYIDDSEEYYLLGCERVYCLQLQGGF